jgi:peptidoglycan/LPS O-acetylase OafA/YrhL
LRFFLALSVVIGHSDHSFGLHTLHTTVAVRSFYIISGFYMALVLNSKYRDKPYYVFIRSRYLRLFPAYFSVLMLTLLYGLAVYLVRGIEEWPLHAWAKTIAELRPSSVAALAFSNIFILGQDILHFIGFGPSGNLIIDITGRLTAPPFGDYMFIPQAWTLGLELLFYMLAPFIVTRGPVCILGVMLASLACRNLLFPYLGVDPDLMGYRFFPFELVYFTFGALSYEIYRALSPRRIKTVLCLASATFLFLLYAVPLPMLPDWIQYAALATCIPVLFSLTQNNRADRLIGELSYPMYISHMLVLHAVARFTTWGTESSGTVITIILSYLIYRFVDKRTDAWREALPKTFPGRFPGAKTWAICGAAICLCVSVPLAIRHVAQAKHIGFRLPLSSYDLLKAHPDQIVAAGLDPTEASGNLRWRWGFGPMTELVFYLPHAANLTLTFEYSPLMQDQSVSIVFNDITLETINSAGPGTVYRQYLLPGRMQHNVVRFVYRDWNGREKYSVPEDSRPLAASFTQFNISFPESSG